MSQDLFQFLLQASKGHVEEEKDARRAEICKAQKKTGPICMSEPHVFNPFLLKIQALPVKVKYSRFRPFRPYGKGFRDTV